MKTMPLIVLLSLIVWTLLMVSGCASTRLDMGAWSTRDLTAIALRGQPSAVLDADRTECVAQIARLPRLDLLTLFVPWGVGDEFSKRIEFTECMTAKGYAIEAAPREAPVADPALSDRAHGR